jgi:hypothetical protein
VLQSQTFDAAYWGKTNSTVTANQVVAPDGTLTADVLNEGTATGGHYIAASTTSSAGVTFTASIYAKAGTASVLQILYDGISGASDFCNFDLANGVLGSGTGGQIVSVGNGWYRCSITGASDGVSDGLFFVIANSTTAGRLVSFTGTNRTLTLWGAQLEATAFTTSYIATVASQVTRAADAASMTGTNFSSWFNNAEGTVYAETVPYSSGYVPIFQVDNGTANNRILLEGGVDSHGFIQVNSITQCSLDMGATSANTNAKFAFAYKVDDFAGSLNAGTVSTDTSGLLPVVNTARIGANTSAPFSQTIKKLSYFPRRLSNAELQEMTS